MPKYNRIKYGKLHKYGKYILTGGGKGSFTLGGHTSYRIRFHSHKGKVSDTLTLYKERVSIPSGEGTSVRIRTNANHWVRVQQEKLLSDKGTLRIRAIGNQRKSEWVYSDRANLKQL